MALDDFYNYFPAVSSWVLNIVSAIVTIFANKQLMSQVGCGFSFACTLSGTHFLISAASIRLFKIIRHVLVKDTCCETSLEKGGQNATSNKAPVLKRTDLLAFIVAANGSIVGLNVSLMLNTLGFYQVLAFNRSLSLQQILAVTTVTLGVGIVSVTGAPVVRGFVGLLAAVVSIIGSGFQAVLVRHFQCKYKISSEDLLGQTSVVQGCVLLIFGPIIDRYITGLWVQDYAWTSTSFIWFSASCLAAVAVNLSQYMILGQFNAGTYAVIGHIKTILILIGGYVLFNEDLTCKQITAVCAAIGGMLWYGNESRKNEEKQTAKS